jgi:hypothetical protein
VVGAAAGPDAPEVVRGDLELPGRPSLVVRSRRPGSILAFDAPGLVRFAQQPECRAAVEDELLRLEADVAREFGASADLDRAGEADRQGLGGALGLGAPETLIER